MAELEGTIQFAYELTPDESIKLSADDFADLSAWRSLLFDLRLLGQTPDRYQGYGYGNLSVRADDAETFVVTASQTSGEATLLHEHLVLITHCNLERFWVDASGSEPPSSESMTHAMIYQADPRIRCVFHVHCPDMWGYRTLLKLPQTPVDVPYGSPAMVAAVRDLLETNQSRPLIFATAGHEDGIFACGHNPRECGALLLTNLARARALKLKEGDAS